jgi:hypothetical protein
MKYRADKPDWWNKARGLVEIVKRLLKKQPKPAPKPTPTPPPPAPIPVPVPVPAGNLFFTKHDGVKRGPKGDPETNKTLNDSKFLVTSELAAQMRQVLHLLNPDMNDWDFEKNWNNLYASNRFIANKSGVDSGEFKLENLDMGGATHEAITGVPYTKNGKMWIDVKAIDPKNLPPMPNTIAEIDRTVWSVPVVATQDKDGNFRADPFPAFGGRCMYPFVGKDGVNAIEFSMCLPVGSIQHPFSPAHYDVIS